LFIHINPELTKQRQFSSRSRSVCCV